MDKFESCNTVDSCLLVSNVQIEEVHFAQRLGTGIDTTYAPEDMFKQDVNPGIEHSGILQYAAEHIGDLVHRLSYTQNMRGGIEYGIDAALIKSQRNYKLDDIDSKIERNFVYFSENGFSKSLADMRFEVSNASKNYADAYRKIPVYTEFHQLGRDAAIALGEGGYFRVNQLLKELSVKLKSINVRQEYYRF